MSVTGFWSEVLKGYLNFVKGMAGGGLEELRWNVQAWAADNDRPWYIYSI